MLQHKSDFVRKNQVSTRVKKSRKIKKKFYNLGFQNESTTKKSLTLSACVLDAFNGYKVAQKEFGNKGKRYLRLLIFFLKS